jgi:hypothetical protein
MAIFRLPLFFNRRITFWRLMGSGKNGTFDKIPDLHQWAILCVFDASHFHPVSGLNHPEFLQKAYGRFMAGWMRFFAAGNHSYLLEPIEGHGLWNKKEVFGALPKNTGYEGEIAVMTRATIRLNKLSRFWKHVPDAANEMAKAEGFLNSYGVGEWPWIKQATFSLWKTKADMRNFAYKQPYHKEVIRKTHEENWYSEEMFVRFKILGKF